MDYDEDIQQKDPDADLPLFRIRHNDMKIQTTKLIVRGIVDIIQNEKKKSQGMLEKDVCLKLVYYMKQNKAQFGGGQGQWQCILGKNMAATLNYDLHMLTFFDLPQYGYTVLVFKSG